jgi:hypothetical protein
MSNKPLDEKKEERKANIFMFCIVLIIGAVFTGIILGV